MTASGTHFIGNQWIGGTGAAFSSMDPATGQTIWQGSAASENEVHLAVEAARAAFEGWADTTLTDRVTCIEAFGKQLRREKESLAATISRDTGKPRWEALTEVDSMIGKIAVSIDAYNDRCDSFSSEFAGATAITRFKPHGVVAVFGPFNLPGHLPNGHIVPALIAGNTMVFKPSEQAPLVAEKMMELWQAAGMQPGVINMVQGGRETVIALSGHADLDGLFFTGSAATGKALHRAFAGHPEKMLVLEMGGNNPLIVWDASDLTSAAYLTVLSAFITSGQRCTCARRLIIQDGIYGAEFVDHLVSMIKKIRVGSHTDSPEPFMGPIISEQAAQQLLSAQSRLLRSGADALVEMKHTGPMPTILSPGLIDVTNAADRRDEELFGPLLQLIRVPDFDAALVEADNTAYGLAAGLISDSKELYERFYSKMRSGVINWNRQTTGASAAMPFGGVRGSGNHRPSAYFAADYCSYPVASIEIDRPGQPAYVPPGIEIP